jgi:hypothetical protein
MENSSDDKGDDKSHRLHSNEEYFTMGDYKPGLPDQIGR